MGCGKGGLKKKIYGDKCLHSGKELSQINDLNLYLEKLEREEQTEAKVSRRKEVKTRAEHIRID